MGDGVKDAPCPHCNGTGTRPSAPGGDWSLEFCAQFQHLYFLGLSDAKLQEFMRLGRSEASLEEIYQAFVALELEARRRPVESGLPR